MAHESSLLTAAPPSSAGTRNFLREARLYAVAVASVGCATSVFWLVRGYVDAGQASLLYLPVVIGCAIVLGFAPSVMAAAVSFLCWDYFFLPPYQTLTVASPKNWLSLVVFLVAAVTTARLASNARDQAEQARMREHEIAVLFQASETLSREVSLNQVVSALAAQLRELCHVRESFVWRALPSGSSSQTRLVSILLNGAADAAIEPRARELAEAAARNRQVIGFDAASRAIWEKAAGHADGQSGAYIPLQTDTQVVGVLEIGQRADGKPFSALDQRLILTLANHVAVVLARERLAEQAAQAEALRESDALKDSLLSMVSHELRSPLAAIKATATGLAAGLPDGYATAADDLQVINGEVDRLSGIVGNLLDLSRLEGGAWRPERDWCDIGEIIATALDRLPDDQAQRVMIDVSGDAPLIQVDYTQIALVITNLLQNAVKYTPHETPIEISATRSKGDNRDENRAALLVRVRDFGTGIAPGDEQLVFTRFYRSPAHQRSTIRGTGLGLALCEAIVRAHGGRIWAANAPAAEPGGAIFSFSLPIVLEHASGSGRAGNPIL